MQCVEFKPQRHSRFNGNIFNLVGCYGTSISRSQGLYPHMAKGNTVNRGVHTFFQLVEQSVFIFRS